MMFFIITDNIDIMTNDLFVDVFYTFYEKN